MNNININTLLHLSFNKSYLPTYIEKIL